MATRQTFTYEKRLRVYNMFSGHCAYCDKYLDVAFFTIDHVIPLAKGGTNSYDNLALACHRCNANKGDELSVQANEVRPPKHERKSYWFKGKKYYKYVKQ